MTLLISQATEADGPACRALFCVAFKDFLHRLGRPLTSDAYDWILPAVSEGRVLFATNDSVLCVAAVWFDQGNARVIEQVGVLPDQHGHGIGSALLDFIENAARQAGKHKLELCTPAMMTHLVTLYQNRGFAIDHIAPADHGLDPHPRVFLSKSLN